MAVRGVYTEDEKSMIDAFNSEADMLAGWAKQLNRKVATEESIKNTAIVVDYWNPLWRDENYAAGTRWGGIIAPPLYQDSVAGFHFGLKPPPGLGYELQLFLGEDWELYKPVRVNDTFRAWRRRAVLEDITGPDGDGPRRFRLMPHDIDIINQRDELVSTEKVYVEYTYFPEQPGPEHRPEYAYTREELDYIKSIEEQEDVRGADIRYWEDVTVGDMTKPVALGPTTLWDLINFFSGGARPPLRELRKRSAGIFVVDPDTGVTHSDTEKHLSHHIARLRGEPYAFHSGSLARQLMVRLVTNWIGDDGFIRTFKWRHMVRSTLGDTYFGKGKVTGKRIVNGEHLVDLKIWLENIRGHITEAAAASVSLCSREGPYTWN